MGGITYQHDAASPKVTFDTQRFQDFLSQQALSRGVSDDVGWAAAMATIFAQGSNPGVSAATLTFLQQFFTGSFHISGP